MSSDLASRENTEKPLNEGNGCGDVIGDIVEDIWKVMTPEMVERLKCVLTEDLGLTKKDADKLIQCQRDIRRQRICLKKDKRAIRIGPRNQWIKELSREIADQMAMLIVNILLSNRTSQTKKITEKVLDHLCKLTGENTTVESAKTRVERTMVVVADRIATWIGDTISKIELEMKDKFEKYESLETLSRKSLVTLTSLETESITESEEIPLDDISDITISESEVESSIKSITSEEKEYSKSDEEVEEEEEETSEEDSEVYEESELLEEEQDTIDDDEESEIVEEEEEVEEEDDDEKLPEEEDIVEEEEIQEEEETDDETEEESVQSEDELEKPIESIKDSITGRESIVEPPSVQSEVSSKVESAKVHLNILELLETDMNRVSKPGETTSRHKAMKEIIDKRFEKIEKERLDKSLDSLEMLDIDKAASIVANWVEKILSSADILPELSPAPSVTKGQGSAYEVKRGEGSKYQVCKLSSTTVAEKITVVRGLDPPLRNRKIPKSFSPMNFKSTKDWTDWVLGTAKVGEEWGKWLDTTLVDIEQQLSKYKSSQSHERYETWRDFRDKREQEAQKWRVQKQKIKYEGELWNRKLNIDKKPEKETKVLTYSLSDI